MNLTALAHTLRGFLLLALLAWVGAVFVSCGGERRQAAAEAVAGIEALRDMAEDPEPAEAVADGAVGYVAAAAGTTRDKLPAPKTNPKKDPEGYRSKGKEVESSAGMWLGIGTGALAILALVLRITGAGGPAGALLAGLLENATLRRKRENVASAADTLGVIVRAIEGVGPETDVKTLKKVVSKVVTPEQEASIRRELEEVKRV